MPLIILSHITYCMHFVYLFYSFTVILVIQNSEYIMM